MGRNKRQNLPPLDIGVPGSTTEGRGSAAVELGGVSDHIGNLRQVSAVSQKLASILADQLQELARTIPVLRGFEIVCAQFHPIILA
jgi:hypothetical protein